ncbi:hypothetical protein ACE6H2_005382 [Prunus campanulata]
MGVHRTISTSGPRWVTRDLLPGVVSAATVVFLRMSISSFSSPICKPPIIDRVGLISFFLILLVLAALHVLEPIGQLSRHLFGIETPIGYDPFESLKNHLQPLGLGALVVALFFLGNYHQSRIAASTVEASDPNPIQSYYKYDRLWYPAADKKKRIIEA